MAKNKRKKFFAWILSGALLAGSISPVTANAAEVPEKPRVSDETMDGTAGEEVTEAPSLSEEESSVPEKEVEEESAEESANEEGTTEENTVEDGTIADGTIRDDAFQEDEISENAAEENTEEENRNETETEGAEENSETLMSDRQISNNILSGYNTSFEGTDGSGNLHWWSDANWVKVGISRKAYGEGDTPSGCGSYYMEVTPVVTKDGKEQSIGQMSDGGIAAIIEPEITYEFTYFAKLSEGENQQSGKVELQIQSVESGWASTKDAVIKYDEKDLTLNSTQWKQVSGTFKLPAHEKRKDVAIKFLGVDGISFLVDDLRVAALESGRQIPNNILSGYNTDCEGLDNSGSLGWWSDTNWKKDGISRKEHGEGGAPSGSGSYYMEVIPVTKDGKEQSIAQMNDKGIAEIIKPEITYEFTYFAKLSDSQESGDVQLAITSHNGWSSQKAAEFTYDSDVTLNAAEWKQVSGTFVIPAQEEGKHTEVVIKFEGKDGVAFCIDDLRVAAVKSVDYGDNLVENPNFAEDDISVWKGGNISKGQADEAIFDEVTTYGMISERSSNFQCFEQDMTGKIKSGKSYEYSFWVMLDAQDYKDAPAEQREVSFSPYVKVGDDTKYWGSYDTAILDKGCSKRIEAGKWVKFEGSFNPKYDGEADKLAIRILEQGTQSGSGSGVQGKYYITGVSVREVEKPIKEIEWDIPNLKDAISGENGIGIGSYTGAAISNSQLSDETLMDLVHKHFNAVTFENEMKMDAMFGYSKTAPNVHSVSWTRADGTVLNDYKVPTIDFSAADKMLAVIKKWNDENPDNAIKVRGHVLVWHSQAPEWFFHEDWDESKPDVSPEEMDERQEWYIKSVLEHYFTEEGSPYKDIFYGWDVVNEAVSDGRGTYRDETEKSSWWRVYKSEEYIINAFRYANKYAPASIELYYNDYNECTGNKVGGIEKLLQAVKAHEKDEKLPTRISGMGMQSHHNMSSPTANQLRDAAVKYGNVVGKVQLTELDIKASNDFDGTDATLESEYTRQAYRYKEIYDVMREVDAMPNIDVNGITVWGVIDKNSWLQSSNSAGGGADGSKKQVPLLFDDDYKAKPAFYAFVNAAQLEPFINNVTVMQAAEGDPYAWGKTYRIQGTDAEFIPVWTDTGLKVQVTVSDDTADPSDGVKLYVDWDKSMSGASIITSELARTECQAKEGGYVAEFEILNSGGLMPAVGFSMDVVVTDNGKGYAFNDLRMTQAESSKYYALATTKPYMTINKVDSGKISVDGEVDSEWEQAAEVQLVIRTGNTKASAAAKLLWDEQYLYVLADVEDSVLDGSGAADHEQDSLEVFIDENNHKSDSYEEDDKQYRVNYQNVQSFNGPKCTAENIQSATAVTDKGYRVEAAYKWTDVVPAVGNEIGIELQINDAEGGTRIGTISWFDESGQGWGSPRVFGTAALKDASETPEKPADKGELSGLIAEYAELKQDDYTEESWGPFAEAMEAAKAALENPDISQEEIRTIYNTLKQAKEGLKPSGGNVTEPVDKNQLRDLIGECEGFLEMNYTPESWKIYTKALEDARAAAENPEATKEEIQIAIGNLTKAMGQLEEKEGLWAVDIADITYTGKALKPTVIVYDGTTLLTQGKDYTVSYRNNTKVGTATATIKGKGNYAESIIKEFAIVAKDLQDADISIPNLYVMAPKGKTPKAVVPKPAVTRNGKKLKLKTEYTVECIDKSEGAYVLPGTYKVRVNAVEGKGYTGYRDIDITLADPETQVLMSKAKITKIPNQTYHAGEAIEPTVTVKVGRVELTPGVDYTVSYEDNREIGTATVTVKGIRKSPAGSTVNGDGEDIKAVEYIGEKQATFKITGTPLKAQSVTLKGVTSGIPYTGSPIEPDVEIDGLVRDTDYTVDYRNHTNKGTASVIVKGMGAYTGTVKKTFKITAFDIGTNAGQKFRIVSENISVPYAKGKSKPSVEVAFGDTILKEGMDYTLSYKNNDKAGGERQPEITIKGKGNFAGTAQTTFTITKQDIKNLPMTAADTLEKNAKKYNKVNPVVTDLDGKKLKKGTDYIVTGYIDADTADGVNGEGIVSAPKAGDRVRITLEGAGNYTGEWYVDFRIIANDKHISKAKITVEPQVYTGRDIEPKGEAVVVTVKGKNPETNKPETVELKEGIHYEIVEDGYSKNINKGTGKMTVRGIGEYGGTKTASFKIQAQKMNWADWYKSMAEGLMELLGQ